MSVWVGKYDGMKVGKLIRMCIMNDKWKGKTVIRQRIKASGIPSKSGNIGEMLYLKCDVGLY